MDPSASPTILIVEDHVPTRRFLADNLEADGYPTLEAGTLARARELIAGRPAIAADRPALATGAAALAADRPALVILDLQLPDGDGLDLLAALRDQERWGGVDPGLDPQLPVLVLSGRAGEIDRVRGLSRGADDYLPKPFGYTELRARVQALLRRATRWPTVARLRVATLELDPRSREVWLEGRPVHLSGKEFALARMLASAPSRTFTRDELLREVWGYRSPGRTRTLDTHAHRLRQKLSSGRVAYVVNVWGVGYRLCDAAVTGAAEGVGAVGAPRAVGSVGAPGAMGSMGSMGAEGFIG